MKTIYIICKYEALTFIRSNLFKTGILVVFLLGVYSIFHGKSEIDHQKDSLVEIKKHETTNMAITQANFKNDTFAYIIGNLTFKLVDNPPSSWANLSIGQRDIYPFYVFLRYWSLSRQILTTEINNPEKLLVGNFDLAFVFIYVFPLFIIAIGYNIVSSEREGGTLHLLLSNPISIYQVLFIKLLFRWVVVFLLAFVLMLLALIICTIQFDAVLILWLLTTALYFTFWFGIILIIAKLSKSSSIDALSLVCCWILFVLIIPTVINLFLTNFYPPSPRYDISHTIRHEYEGIWSNFDKRYHVAQSRHSDNSETTDSSKLNDIKEISVLFDSYDEKLGPLFTKYEKLTLDKEAIGQELSLLSSAALTQQIYNCLANTDAKSYFNFLEDVKTFHKELKDFFFKKIFNDQLFTKADFAKIPNYHFKPENTPKHAFKSILYLFIWTTLVLGIGLKMRFKKI
ncbi:MAG: ABC transporter permease subunit [Alphaproteobacteria bacterium]|nr:ABC transporter permease subunit [Alphaproteobacteria bacterium]